MSVDTPTAKCNFRGTPLVVISPRAQIPITAPAPRAMEWRRPPTAPAGPSAWSPRSGTVDFGKPAKTGSLQTIGMVGITALVCVLGAVLGDRLTGLGNWSYLAVALAEFMDSATPFIPTPAHAYTYTVAGHWNSMLVVAAATVGSTVGETVGYLAGCKGQQAIQSSRVLRACAARFGRWEGRVIIALAALPFPVYLSGVWAGALGVSYRRFFAYAVGGKTILFGTLAVLAMVQR